MEMRFLDQLKVVRAQHPSWSHERVYSHVKALRQAQRAASGVHSGFDHSTRGSYSVYFINDLIHRYRSK